MDTRVKLAVALGLVGLTAGVLAIATAVPAYGLVAGILAVSAALGAVALEGRARFALDERDVATAQAEALRREVHALAELLDASTEGLRTAPAARMSTFAAPERDAVTGLLDGRYFAVLVEHRVATARRNLQPVSIAMFEVDGQTDDALKAMAALGEVIRDTLRECDAVCALGSNRAAAVLEGTAEQGAVWVSERVRHNLRAHPIGRSISVATGIASYPMHALGAPELVTLATEALQNARRRGSDSVEIAAID